MDASNETQKVFAQKITSGTDSNHWWETSIDQLNPREPYERYSHSSELRDLFHISRSKKIATASFILAPTGPIEDALTPSYNHDFYSIISQKFNRASSFCLFLSSRHLSAMANTGKKIIGRQKIELKMIENEDDRLITFSKRKPFAYAHPSIESIVNYFVNGSIPVIENTRTFIEAHRRVRINKLIQLYNEVRSQMDASNEPQKLLAQLITSETNSNRSSTNDTPISQSFLTYSTSLEARRLQQLLQCLLQRVLLKMSLLTFLQVKAMVANNSKQL
ncbi:hypothetical protein CXB51_010365 [Gossypium anomalum]|uniref:MADS-box domain-containing protein n=1 Tax=Gossypium anomalum TaxID=47600 RepID=A0A8J6CZG3_9ROSI|nr:hypothetical protein CXB51_010365 [Gossypium anomalum]